MEGTNTIFFVKYDEIPKDRIKDVTYGRIVVDYRPQKSEPHRTRLTVGGNLIKYPGDVSTPTADMTAAKVLFNSILSTPNAKFMSIDIKNFYLGTPMERYEYVKIKVELIPEEIITQYDLQKKIHNGFIYCEVRKGMYGLPQAGMIANKLLQKRLKTKGYYQVKHTPGLWKHTWRPIMFVLVMDDFGIKYVGKEHA